MPEDDHGAVFRRKLAERGEHGLRVRRSLLGPVGRRELQRGLADLGPQRPGPRPVDRAVDDDPVEPRPERTAAVEPVERPDRGKERLLRDVLGRGAVVDDEVGGAVGARPVLPEERLEVGQRARLGTGDPGALVGSQARHGAVPVYERWRRGGPSSGLRASDGEGSRAIVVL